jgi:hypothetical protein
VELDVLTGGEVEPVVAVQTSEAGQAPGLLGEEDAPGHPVADHEDVVLLLGAHPVGLEGVTVLGGEPAVTLGGQARQVDLQSGPLGRRYVRCRHGRRT